MDQDKIIFNYGDHLLEVEVDNERWENARNNLNTFFDLLNKRVLNGDYKTYIYLLIQLKERTEDILNSFDTEQLIGLIGEITRKVKVEKD